MSLTKVVVTGGAGFIGSHLCRRLLAEQHAVVCVDNLITGSIGNIDDMLDHPRFTFVDADVTTEIPGHIRHCRSVITRHGKKTIGSEHENRLSSAFGSRRAA